MFGWFKKKQTAGDIIEAYGELLEKYPMSILDVSMLPLPKTKMKLLLKSYYARASNEDQERVIENSYLLLGQFQDGVGPKPITATLLEGDVAQKLDANIAIMAKWTAWEKLALAE